MKIIDFKNASCKHCYKCVRSCSVKAIKVKDAQAEIMKENCILCGKCLEVCPQNAKTFVSDLDRVKYYIRSGEKVVVSIAPSYLGIMDYDVPGQVVDGLLKLGFTAVRETAEGAALVTEAYVGIMSEGQMTNIITTCCPSVNDL
ncbi:MAG: 4Fe-4S binding protein, partial [Frisingicoccus sp.]|nr:4Fe-4S binding protein [Frisingicoccus sp.]